MKSLLLSLFVLCFACISCDRVKLLTNDKENSLNLLTVKKSLDEAANLMDEARMAEAQSILIETLQNESIELSKADKYYLNSFLAEVMYYSAHFDQGMNYSRMAKALAI